MIKCRITGLEITPGEAVVMDPRKAMKRLRFLTEELRRLRMLMDEFGPENLVDLWNTAVEKPVRYECNAMSRSILHIVVPDVRLRDLFIPYIDWMNRVQRIYSYLQRQSNKEIGFNITRRLPHILDREEQQ